MSAENKQSMPENSRLSSPVKKRGDTVIVDIDHYAPFLLNAVGSAWLRKTSGLYRQQFNLGITEWRVIAMLNIEPLITANRVCEVIRLDKAAASRSLKILCERGYANFETSATDNRKRRWLLSPQGLAIHEKILDVALRCEAELVADIAPDELETFYRVTRQMLANFD